MRNDSKQQKENLYEKNFCNPLGCDADGTRNALQTVCDFMNHGQQKQIAKDEAVKKLFDLYGVEYEE